MSWVYEKGGRLLEKTGLKRRNDEAYGPITIQHAGRMIRTKARADLDDDEEEEDMLASFAKQKPGGKEVVFPMGEKDVHYITDIINETDERRRAALILNYGCNRSRNMPFLSYAAKQPLTRYNVSRIATLWRCATGFPVGAGKGVAAEFAKMAATLIVRENGIHWTRWAAEGGDRHADVGVDFIDAVRAQVLLLRGYTRDKNACPPVMAKACVASKSLSGLCQELPKCESALRRRLLTFRNANSAHCCFLKNSMYQLKEADSPTGPMRLVISTIEAAASATDAPVDSGAADGDAPVNFGATVSTTDVPVGRGLRFCQAWDGPGAMQQAAIFGRTLFFVAEELEPERRSVVCAHDLDSGVGRRAVVAEMRKDDGDQGLFLPHVHYTDGEDDWEVDNVWVCLTAFREKVHGSDPWYDLKFISFPLSKHDMPSFQTEFERNMNARDLACFGVQTLRKARDGCLITLQISGPVTSPDAAEELYDYFVEQQFVNSNTVRTFGLFTHAFFQKAIGKETNIRSAISKIYPSEELTYYAWNAEERRWCQYRTMRKPGFPEKTLLPSTSDNAAATSLFLRSKRSNVVFVVRHFVDELSYADGGPSVFVSRRIVAKLVEGYGAGLVPVRMPDVKRVHFTAQGVWMCADNTIFFQALDDDCFEAEQFSR